MKKKILLIISLCLCMISLTGCSYIRDKVSDIMYNTIVEITSGLTMDSQCTVASIGGMVGTHEYICQNSSNTYIHQRDGIYEYDSMQKIVDTSERSEIDFMACNDDVLYYVWGGNELWCYNFAQKKEEFITDKYVVNGMRANGDDIFMLMHEIGENWDGKTHFIYYYHKDEAAVNISDLVINNEADYIQGDYSVYEFAGYHLVVDNRLETEIPAINFIENADGFQYSCFGEKVYTKINDEYMELTQDIRYRYQGVEIELTDIVNASEMKVYLSPSLVGVKGQDIYIIAQYQGTPHGGIGENPFGWFKDRDALFKFSLETEDCILVYQCKEKEQLAGFSLSKNCVYVQTDERIYEYNLETAEETDLLYNRHLDTVYYEYLDDKLFIFKENTGESKDRELQLVVE